MPNKQWHYVVKLIKRDGVFLWEDDSKPIHIVIPDEYKHIKMLGQREFGDNKTVYPFKHGDLDV